MNGKPRDMDYKFAVKVLNSAKVDTPSMHGNPKRYGYQNQTFYDIARRMAIQALKEKYEKSQPKTNYDRIRNMSVEELASFLNFSIDQDECFHTVIDGITMICESDVVEWLEQEVEE